VAFHFLQVLGVSNSENRDLRTRLIRTFLWACAYAAIAIALIGANPFRGETTGPFDLLASHPGWSAGDEAVPVRHRERSDILDALVPEWMESRRQIRSGVFPFWNPLAAGGHAALLNPANAELTPGFAIFAASPDPALGFYLAVLSSLVIAGLGMHLLVARHYSPWAALFAGISYMASGFITAYLFWPQTYSSIWIPWLLLAVCSYAGSGSMRGLIGIAAFSALMFLGGFPFTVAVGLGAALVHAMVVVATLQRDVRLRRLGGVVAGLGLGLGLVAIPLLTLSSVVGTTDIAWREGGHSALTLSRHWKHLLLPWAGRSPVVASSMYVGMTALLFAVIGLVSLVRRRKDVLAWSAAAFVVVGAVLTFGLLPERIGAHLPVLSNNPWQRAVLLLNIGIILLAALVVDRLVKRIRPRPLLVATGALLCVVQGIDLGQQFRKFNGPTQSKYFYPVSPELALLKRRIRPFQYVAQDSSYFVQSGTLGAIGLGEWFAHSLRSRPMHNLLKALADKPFSSPTSTAIRASAFHWSSDLADAVGLCYAVYPSDTGGRAILAQSRRWAQAPLPAINNYLLVQPVQVSQDSKLSLVSVRLATYRAGDLDGTVTATLRKPGGGALMARSTLPAASVKDNEMATFSFADSPVVAAGDYDLELLYVPGPRNRNMTAWMVKDVPGAVRLGGNEVQGSLDYMLFGPVSDALAVVSAGDTVTVAENPGCVEGVYWSSDLEDPLSATAAGRAQLAQYRPHDFVVQAESSAAGFVIVPMQYQPGWQVRVDDRPVEVKLIRGVLPAVPVAAGTSKVRFVYRPPHWQVGAALSGLALFVLAWLGLRARVRRGAKAGYPDTA
jgi:hypothetical protein